MTSLASSPSTVSEAPRPSRKTTYSTELPVTGCPAGNSTASQRRGRKKDSRHETSDPDQGWFEAEVQAWMRGGDAQCEQGSRGS